MRRKKRVYTLERLVKVSEGGGGGGALTNDLAWNAVSPFKAAIDMLVLVGAGLRTYIIVTASRDVHRR